MASSGGTRLSILLSLLAVACSLGRPSEQRTRGRQVRSAPQTSEPAEPYLYAADEALRDVLSGPWQYVGTGRWPGIRRMYACAFRNERVLLVNVYCSPGARQAFRLDVFSPTKGRAQIYAESQGTVSTQKRAGYFTFTAESEPPPAPSAGLPGLSLALSFEHLQSYDERRYNAFLPSCFGGTEHSRARNGCLGPLAPRAKEWLSRNRAFLEQASPDWYRVMTELRALVARYGREPD